MLIKEAQHLLKSDFSVVVENDVQLSRHIFKLCCNKNGVIPLTLITLITFISFYCWTLISLLSSGWVKRQTRTIRGEIDGAFLPLGLRAYCVTFLNEKWRWGRNETQRGGTSHGGGCRHDSSTSPHRPHLSYQQHPALRRRSGQGLLRRKADKGRQRRIYKQAVALKKL